MTLNHAIYQPIGGDTLTSFSGTAMEWPVSLAFRATEAGNSRGVGVPQAHMICGRCEQSVLCISPDLNHGGAYVFHPLFLAAGVLRHVREAHCDGGGILLPG